MGTSFISIRSVSKPLFPSWMRFWRTVRKRRIGIGGHGDIVKSNDADISRNTVAKLFALGYGGAGECVLAADNGRHAHIKESGAGVSPYIQTDIGASRV